MKWTMCWLAAGCAAGEPPTVVSFDASAEDITEGGEVGLTLVVSDPQGVDDVVSGTIIDVDTQGTLAELGAPDSDGAYSVTVSWDAFADLEPLDFDGTDTRPLEAVVVDKAGQASPPVSLSVAMKCRRAGGVARDHSCFNIRVIGAAANSDCDTLCADRNFICRTPQAVNQFGEVGNIEFTVDDSGQPRDFTLPIPDCETRGDQLEFQIGATTYVLDPSSSVLWTCNCRP